ncbi:MAG: asparagine synthase C-terminal domain-containing protein [Candidatus Anstonellales archaeon]
MNTILNLITRNIPKNKELAIAFSGGIDSSLLSILSRMNGNRVTLYTLALHPNSTDLEYSRRFSLDLGFDLVEVKADDTAILFDKWNRLIGRVKAEVMVGAEIVIRAVREKIILFGSGSEEIFAGYDRHLKSENLKNLLREEFEQLEHNEIKYIRSVANQYGKEALFPFYDRELFDYVMMNYSEEDLLRDRIRKKWVLRDAAKELLPNYILDRPKKALQYGSGINRIISKYLSSDSQQ